MDRKENISNTEHETKNIFQRMSAISSELSTVAKNLEVGVGKNQYKAVGEADVLRAVKPLEEKYGVYSYPYARKIVESGTIENETIDYTTKEKIIKKQLFERIETVYRFVNIENPTDYIDITTYGDGVDAQDKSVGKAMTYGDKYALLKAYKIVTGDDQDQNPSGDLKGAQIKKAPLSSEIMAECAALNVDLQNIAAYLKKSVADLTESEVKACLERKKRAVAKK